MSVPIASPTREACIEATARIVCASIESGQLSASDAKEVGKYFSQVYDEIAQAVKH